MITLHLTDEEAENFRVAMRNAVGGSRSRTTCESCQELADRIQEQQQLILGGWFENGQYTNFTTHEEAKAQLDEARRLYPRKLFRVGRSAVNPGVWALWVQWRQDD